MAVASMVCQKQLLCQLVTDLTLTPAMYLIPGLGRLVQDHLSISKKPWSIGYRRGLMF